MSAYVVSCVARRCSASIQRTLHFDVSWKRFLRRRVAAFAEVAFVSIAIQGLPVCIIWRARTACAPVPMSRQRDCSFCVAVIACVYALFRFLSLFIALYT